MSDKIAYFGFTGPIESGSATRIGAAMNYAVNNSYDGIYLAFSSLGGFIADGVYLYNHIRALPIPVTIHATGNVASVAVAIYAGATRRVCSRHVLFMIHPAAVPGSTEGMTWDRLQQLMNSALAEENRTEGILRDRCSIPDELLTPGGSVKFTSRRRMRSNSVSLTPSRSLRSRVGVK